MSAVVALIAWFVILMLAAYGGYQLLVWLHSRTERRIARIERMLIGIEDRVEQALAGHEDFYASMTDRQKQIIDYLRRQRRATFDSYEPTARRGDHWPPITYDSIRYVPSAREVQSALDALDSLPATKPAARAARPDSDHAVLPIR